MIVTEQAPRPIFKGVGIDTNAKSELKDIIIQPKPFPQVHSNDGGGVISGNSLELKENLLKRMNHQPLIYHILMV